MKLEIKRLDKHGRYETIVTRDDRVSFRVLGVAHNFAIPHDVAHYVIEKALGLNDGFWGNVAAGAVFKSMAYLSGRRKPKAAERSNALLKANARALNETENVVGVLNSFIEQGHGENWSVMSSTLRKALLLPGPKLRSISAGDVEKIYSDYKIQQQRWKTLPVGETLILQW